MAADLRVIADPENLVRLMFGDEPFDGVVVATSPELVQLAVLDEGIRANGVVVLRRAGITAAIYPHPHEDFYDAALRARGERRMKSPRLDLSALSATVADLAKLYPLVSFHVDDDEDSGFCRIGRVESVSNSRAMIREIDTNAKWKAELNEILLEEVSRVDAGGAYEVALATAAAQLNMNA